ncbi:MAG: 1-acyl-sn-glycerol-3-phosphate acyltransferase [Leptospiraceae bacterium]|nr:1-acyl-sn-glycerol-3-phosphate acyltransferase [Leptospiraceae bacterium]
MNPYKYLMSHLEGQSNEYKKLVVSTYLIVLRAVFSGGFPYLVKGTFSALIGNIKNRNDSFTKGSEVWGNKILKFTKTTLYKSNELSIPNTGHMIFVNHVNEIDFPFDCIMINKPFLANQQIKSTYVAYWWMSAMGSQVFDTSKQRTIATSVRNLVAGLKETSFIVYPEGHNTYSEEIKPLKKGMIKVAFENKIPIVVVLKSGVQRLQFKQSGNTIGYRYAGRIEPEKFSTFDEMKEAIQKLMISEKAILDKEVNLENEKNK